MPIRRQRSVLAGTLLAGLLLLWPGTVLGQRYWQPEAWEARASQEARQTCQQIAAAVLAGPRAAEAEALLGQLYFCELSGPAALAAAWRNPVVRANAVNRLVEVSQQNQDRRILEAVLPVLRDEGAGIDARLAAVSLLASYLVPMLRPNPSDWYPDPEQEWPVSIGIRSHATWAIGPQPLDAGAPERILAALNEVLETSGDIRLKRVIEQVLRSWEFWRDR